MENNEDSVILFSGRHGRIIEPDVGEMSWKSVRYFRDNMVHKDNLKTNWNNLILLVEGTECDLYVDGYSFIKFDLAERRSLEYFSQDQNQPGQGSRRRLQNRGVFPPMGGRWRQGQQKNWISETSKQIIKIHIIDKYHANTNSYLEN